MNFNKLFKINKLLGDLPKQVQELTDQEEFTKNSLSEKEEKLKVTTVDMHSSETLIATTQEKVDGLKDKLIDGSISNNKEYDAMMETIDYEKNIIFEKENELLVLMETKETLSKEIDEDKAALDGIIEELNTKLKELLPIAAELRATTEHKKTEEGNFLKLRKEILWWAGAAGVSDAIPGVGIVSVPTIQLKMLHGLANQYGVEWDKKILLEFVSTLGAGFGLRYLSTFGIRQLVKFIPVYGQVVGGASAAVISFCSTYAIGRVACKYMYHKSKGEPVNNDDMRAMYDSAFDSVKELANSEKIKA